MFIYRILYYSRAVNDPDLDEILDTAREINSRNHLTGALWYDGDFFVQALEGTRPKVSETYNRIAKDKRHRDVVIVHCGPIDERMFSEWDMAYYDDTSKNRQLIKRFAGQDFLDPRVMQPETMLKMLKGVNLTCT